MYKLQLNAIEQRLSTQALKDVLKKEFTLQPNAITQLQHHFMLYWDAKYFFKQLAINDDGTLDKEGRKFKVIFHNCTREECKASTQQLALSFRVPLWKYIATGTICPMVLVSCKKSKNHNLHINHKL